MLTFMLGLSVGLLILPICSISIELGRHFQEQRKFKKEQAFEKRVEAVLDRRWLDATLPPAPTHQPASPAPTHQPASDYVDEYW